MILRCSHCRTKFAADDAHRGKTFRCRVCASPIRTDGDADVVSSGGSGGSRGSSPPQQARQSESVRAVAFAPTMLAGSSSVPPPLASGSAGSSAAVVRTRDDERSKRDLFGGEIELSAKVVEHGNTASPFTAARNENSVLFSLDQLSKPRVSARASESVMPSASSTSGAPAKKEDSGLIDLNAMMNEEKLTAKSIRPAPISEAPLGYAREVSLTPVPTVYEASPFAKKKKTGLIVGIAAAVVVALVGVGVVATNNEDARLKAAAAAAAAPPPPPPVTATAEPPPAPAPTIAAVAPADTKESDTKATHSGKSSGARHASAKKSSSAPAAAAAPAAPKKPADPCGCHGDLLCNMRCSSK